MSATRFLDKAMAHVPSLLRAARRFGRNDADSEDLVQDTLVRALEKRNELRDDARLKSWLLAIERTIHLNSSRGLRTRFEVLDGGLSDTQPVEPSGDLDAEMMRGSLSAELLAALEQLPTEWRETLLLREVEELSYEEISEVLDCKLGTVRSRLARARERLFELLNEEARHGGL